MATSVGMQTTDVNRWTCRQLDLPIENQDEIWPPEPKWLVANASYSVFTEVHAHLAHLMKDG